MAICIYEPKATDFSTNGLGLLTPISCTVSAEGCGMFELELTQPIDESMRWAQLQKGCIIKAPVPTRESPLYEDIEDIMAGVSVTKQRDIYVVYNTSVGVYMRSGPGKGYKNYGYLTNGAEVVLLEKVNDNWLHVCVVKGGRVCYMSTKYLKYSRSEPEVVTQTQIVGKRVIEYTQSQDQLFRIYSVERDSRKMTATAKAMHIFYDWRANIIGSKYEPEGVALGTALQEMQAKLMTDMDFQLHIAAGLDTTVSGIYSYKNPVEAMLDPEDGMLKQGGAILERDNYDLYVLPKMTRDNGVTIRRGKNLKGVTTTDDMADVVTRIIPCGKNKDGDDLFLEGTGYVDSPYINDYPFPYVQKIDYDCKTASSKKEADGKTSFASDAETRAQLEKLAREDFSKNGVDLPTYGMKVDFILLQNTEEYANYASLQAVFLHDTVTVIDSVIGVKAKVQVNAYEWNCLTKRYNSVSLGDVSSLEQTVYSYSLPTGGVSGTKIAPGTASGEILRNASIQYAKIAVAAIEQLNADSIEALTARLQEIIAGSITTDELYVAMAEITKATIETADIAWADIEHLKAAVAVMARTEIGTADIDWAHIKDLATDTAIITEGVGGQLFISRLAVTEANMVSLTTGELIVKGKDGRFYSVSVDADGKIQTELKQVSNDDVRDLSINAGEKIIEGSVTAACLNAQDIFAENAVIRQMIAANLDVDTLFAREAFIAQLRTSKIVGDKSITFLFEEAEEALAMANENARVFRQEEFPDGTVLVRPKDVLIQPSSGKIYQAVDISEKLNLTFHVDPDGSLYYDMDDTSGKYSLRMEGFDLYATGFCMYVSEEGKMGPPYEWELVRDVEITNMLDATVVSVDVEYYLSTSSTQLSGGSWSTTAPAWENGKYMWSRTTTTLLSGEIHHSNVTCIAGAIGSTGKDGVGVSAIAEQFYLSTSKVTQTGGSWQDTMPDWSVGTYVWTRSKITYTNGNITYTQPYCDTTWELAEELSIYDSATPPATAPIAGKIWLDRSVAPPVFRRWKGENLSTSDKAGWETVNDTQEISTLLAQVKTTAEAAVSRAEQSHYIQAKPEGLHVGLLDQEAGYARVTYNSFDVVRADGYVSASLGDARQDIGTMTMYATAEGHTAFVPREE